MIHSLLQPHKNPGQFLRLCPKEVLEDIQNRCKERDQRATGIPDVGKYQIISGLLSSWLLENAKVHRKRTAGKAAAFICSFDLVPAYPGEGEG